ncbi:hypothetical protein GCM10027567_03470 [Spongiibacter taiwanensis]
MALDSGLQKSASGMTGADWVLESRGRHPLLQGWWALARTELILSASGLYALNGFAEFVAPAPEPGSRQ